MTSTGLSALVLIGLLIAVVIVTGHEIDSTNARVATIEAQVSSQQQLIVDLECAHRSCGGAGGGTSP